MFIHNNKPWLHATPDFLVTCSCCGDGCGEVKCPFSLKDGDFGSYLQKKSSCLQQVEGKLQLKRDHEYYFQVQQQLLVTGRKYCDFVVCSFPESGPILFVERIMPDLEHWDVVVPNLTNTWRICVLPELTSRWYTRKQHLPGIACTIDPDGICYCRKKLDESERVLECTNKIATSRDFIILVCALLGQFRKHGIVQLVVFSLNFKSQRGVARCVIIILTMKKH